VEDTVAFEVGDVRIRRSEVARDLPVVHEPSQVADRRPLHLDHLGAERGPASCRVGSGHELGHVHDPDGAEMQRESGHGQPAMWGAATPARSSTAAIRKSAASFHGAATS